MADKPKYKLELPYLYSQYKKAYRSGNMAKAKTYKNKAYEVHGVDLDQKFHAWLEKKEKDAGVFGVGKYKRIKYG